MTEPIKQEIINNIFENGDKLITGPILQTVLIDMIDDVNVKDQEILSKTGSWDDAATQIPNLATKAEVTNLSESIARDLENVVDVDLTGYATEQWVQSQGYLTEHQDISNLATKGELNAAENNLQGNITSLSESVARDLANVSVPEGVATEAWVQSQGYLKEHQDISGLATKTELNDTKNNLQGNITSLSESVARDLANVDVDLTGYATEAWVQSQDYASKSYVDNAVSSSSVDLTGYATETWVESQGYLKEHQDISNLATKTELNSVSESIQTDISNLATKGELTSVSESIQTDITNLSESVANSAVWKKGEGESSIVQVIADGTGLPKATGNRAIATGESTVASGNWSHAEGFRPNASKMASHAEGYVTFAEGNGSHTEGYFTKASGVGSHTEGRNTSTSGDYSHAEGYYTTASGESSHAEGGYTTTSNQYEHAQGQYNHNSTNQIFSVGAGEKIGETVTRRNAISILEVPNSDSKILTASFFVQNIGGYDGTNPTPGTNDLATVVSKVSSIWKKGTETDSIVQILTGNNEANTPTATGIGAVAIGSQTTASGQWSHAEGSSTLAEGFASHAEGSHTKAWGNYSHAEGDTAFASEYYSHAEGGFTEARKYYSHAEGISTVASGVGSHAEGRKSEASGECSHAEGSGSNASGSYSHAEGEFTIASNAYEHTQGRYNYTSSNQIFSIGTGNSDTDRRNAVSVLEVDNSGSYTASFFVQNVGGYDGTNPEPGTNDLATVINNLPSGGGSSETLWQKGTGTDSVVQILTGANESFTPTATEMGAIAIGIATIASGQYSHAEGQETMAEGWYSHAEGKVTQTSNWYSHAEGNSTVASGQGSHAEGRSAKAIGECSHAEGHYTIASGSYSHAEGNGTIAANQCEHAQGMFNHSSQNQIFSVGVGEGDPYDLESATRRNAISVLAVSNETTGVNTGSVFVQNIGGYDGTNPTPGTNDLATVLNNTETWTFTLEDGSTVTKTIRIS